MPSRDGDVTLTVGDRQLSGWQEISVGIGIERMPGDFTLLVTDTFPGEAAVPVQPGMECVLQIGTDTVVTGYVDRYAVAVSRRGGTAIKVTGRGRCQDLVDCSAYLRGSANQIRASRARAVIERLAAVYGIEVDARAGDGEVVPQFNVILTETAWDIIDRIARHSDFLAHEGPDGRLVLARLGADRAASGFKEGVNVEEANVTRSADKRYSLYEAVFMPVETLGDVARATASADFNTRASAPDISIGAAVPGSGRRFRPLIIVAEVAQNDPAFIQRRVEWERARRLGRSQAVEVVADSWRDAAGALWRPNTIARVQLPTLGLPDADWLITEVNFELGRSGTRARLTLMPREAFQPQPIILQPFDWQVAEALRPASGPTP
ncbi:phage baseplate assembly protein [Falsiroseomonas sp. CW058]|uniref:phage baseplate assembly protein n=1 Tax=Falsiroseomonas sp. CW058 TaxID=3388664 RepID=UPI003D31C52B